MTNTYGGESNAKKLARAQFWRWMFTLFVGSEIPGSDADLRGMLNRIRREITAADYHLASETAARCVPTAKVLVLCGPHGCDARVAASFGFRPENILAVDRDPAAIESAAAELATHGLGRVRLQVGDFVDALRAERFDIVFFDSCSPILHIVPTILSELVAQYSGRLNSSNRRLVSFVGFGGMYGRDGRYLTRRGSRRADAAADTKRERAFTARMRRLSANAGGEYATISAISYHSRRANSAGTPMLYVGGGFRTWAQLREAPHLLSRRMRKVIYKQAKKSSRALASIGCGTRHQFERIGHDVDGVKVRAEALRLRRVGGFCSQRIADTLCLDPGTVRAWLAHDTRGTYDGG